MLTFNLKVCTAL